MSREIECMENSGVCGDRDHRRSSFPLGMAGDGERVRIVSVHPGRKCRERLLGMGIQVDDVLRVAQRREMGAVLIALNMTDIATERGITVDAERLARQLGCPVVPLVASKGRGIERLRDAIADAAGSEKRTTAAIAYPAPIQEAVARLRPHVQAAADANGYAADRLAVKLLEGGEPARATVGRAALAETDRLKRGIEESLGDDADILIATARYGCNR